MQEMPEKPFLGAFTDVPGREGFEDVRKRPGWREYPEEPPAMRMPRKPELEGFVTPDYSATGRQRFEKMVFTKIGGNPAKIDVMKEVSKSNKVLPQMFAEYFMGRVIWEDRGRLSKEQADEWEDVTKRWRAHVYNMVTSKKNTMIDEHKWMMDTFDSKATEYKAALKRERVEHKERLKEWKAAREPGELVTFEAKERIKRDVATEYPKLPKPPTPTEIRMTAKDVASAEITILETPEDPTVKGAIGLFNQYATKPYCYIWKDEIKKVGWLGIDWLAEDEPAGAGKIKLPKIKGKQAYAKDVWDTAQQHGITFEEVLKRIGALK